MITAEPVQVETQTVRAVLNAAVNHLNVRAADVLDGRNPLHLAKDMLAEVLQLEVSRLRFFSERMVTSQELLRLEDMLRRFERHEPIQYILGHTYFYGYKIFCAADVLIPRPDTEVLLLAALDFLKELGRPAHVLELGTGTGCLSLALYLEAQKNGLPLPQITMTDLHPRALDLAKRNLSMYHLDETIGLVESDLFASLPEQQSPGDLIISNPPYISEGRLAGLDLEVQKYESPLALDGGPDGLSVIRRIIAEAPGWLASGGRLILEHDFDQRMRVHELFEQCGSYRDILSRSDLAGRDRVTQADRR